MTNAEESECPVCGSRNLMHCYGIAFGGLGSYTVCEDCDEVICKHVTLPGQCLHGLETGTGDRGPGSGEGGSGSGSGREPVAGSREPTSG